MDEVLVDFRTTLIIIIYENNCFAMGALFLSRNTLLLIILFYRNALGIRVYYFSCRKTLY